MRSALTQVGGLATDVREMVLNATAKSGPTDGRRALR
jgi:hypothetical protein